MGLPIVAKQPLFSSAVSGSFAAATYYTQAFPFQFGRDLVGEVQVTAGTGTVTGTLQTSFDEGATWVDVLSTAALTAAGTAEERWTAERLNDGLGTLNRFRMVVATASADVEAVWTQRGE